MPRIELIYDDDCPNVEAAQQQLRRALDRVGLSKAWRSWNRADPASPEYVRRYGSPTILVDGRDVVGSQPTDRADCCRVYIDPQGNFRGVPPEEAIVAALRGNQSATSAGESPGGKSGSRSWLAAIPALVLAMLPTVTCPACWPASAGLLGALGLPFLANAKFLLPVTAIFLAVAVATLAYRAKRRRGYRPSILGALAAIAMVAGKFVLENDPMTLGGIGLLIAASVWNSWPRTALQQSSCPSCVEGEPCDG